MKNEPSWCSVGEYLATRLEQAGVRHYFTVPGDFNLVLLDQLLKNPRLQLIGCCNELNAGYAAEGYARSNGIGAFVVTYSVGGLSALNAVACAYAEDLPVARRRRRDQQRLRAEGPPDPPRPGRGALRLPAADLRPGDGRGLRRRHLDDAPGLIDRAIDLAVRRRKPVYLEIACNLAPLAVAPPRPKRFSAGRPSDPRRPGRRRRARRRHARRGHAAGPRRGLKAPPPGGVRGVP